MVFEHLRPKTKTRITSLWGHQLVDALELLYGMTKRRLTLENLRSLSSDLLPSINKYYNIGIEGLEWNNLFANYGYFQSNVFVQGKRVIKDGDPITVSDFGVEAYSKLKSLTESVKESIERVYGKIKPLVIDEYGRVGVIIYELTPSAIYSLAGAENIREAIREELAPHRYSPIKIVNNETISASSYKDVDIVPIDGYSAIGLTIQVTFLGSATGNTRVYYLYSPDGVNYDTTDEAENEGNYVDILAGENVTKQITIIVPIVTRFLRIRILNQDTSVNITCNAWITYMR